jgi:hypothetical protein
MKKLIEYFPHDYKARTDPKLIKLRMKKGFAGLGIYWSLIELLYEANGYMELAEVYVIAFELGCTQDEVLEIIEFEDLFIFLDKQKQYADSPKQAYFYSNERVLLHLSEREKVSKQAAINANKRWQSDRNATAMRGQSNRNANKEKKKKEENKKGKEQEEKDFQAVLDAFRAACVPPMPNITILNEQRRGQLRRRIKEHGLQAVLKAMEKAGASDFLTGKVKDYIANFDFLIKKANFIKLIEGNYDNKKPNKQRNSENDYNHDQ